MAAFTAIELGPDSCVLARVRRARNVTILSALHVIEPSQWPAQAVALADELRRVRKEKGFPRRARIVLWGVDDPVSANDSLIRSMTEPIAAAGFRIEAAFSPPAALALLANERPRPTSSNAAAWLALNRHGAAIAIVRDRELLYSRTFGWTYRAAVRPQEQLLQRYSLVAHLAPELRHGIDLVRGQHFAQVDTVITCGDLPDLRSLTMPLIEELDAEVETLDSAEGIDIEGSARTDRVSEWLPALRLACATASAKVARPSLARPLAAAAVIVLLAGLGWLAFTRLPQTLFTGGPPPAEQQASQSRAPAQPGTQTPRTEPPRTEAPRTEAPRTEAPRPPAPAPVAPTPAPRTEAPAPRTEAPAPRTEAPAPRTEAPAQKAPAAPSAPPAPPAPTAGAPVLARRPRADTPAGADAPAIGYRPQTLRTPLKDPLPIVNSILVAPDRRLAVLNGEIVREGDTIGARVLTRIEPSAVVLREPSGLEIRVPIRGRMSRR